MNENESIYDKCEYYESLIVHRQAEILLPKRLGYFDSIKIELPPNILPSGASAFDFAMEASCEDSKFYFLVECKKTKKEFPYGGDKNKCTIGLKKECYQRFIETNPSDLPFEVSLKNRFLIIGSAFSGEMYFTTADTLQKTFEINGTTYPYEFTNPQNGDVFINFSANKHFNKLDPMSDDARQNLQLIQEMQIPSIPRRFIPKTLPPQAVKRLHITEDLSDQKLAELADNSVDVTSADDDVDIDIDDDDKNWWRNDPRFVPLKEIVSEVTSSIKPPKGIITYYNDIDNNWLITFSNLQKCCGMIGENSFFQKKPITLAKIARAFQDKTYFFSTSKRGCNCHLKVDDAIAILKKFIVLKQNSLGEKIRGYAQKAKESVKIMEMELAELQANSKISSVIDTTPTTEPAPIKDTPADIVPAKFTFREQLHNFISSFNALRAEGLSYEMPEQKASLYALKHMTDYDFDVDEFIETFIKKIVPTST